MPRRGVPLCCIKVKWLTLLTIYQCMMYVCWCTDNTTTHLTHCRCGFGGRTIAWNAKKTFNKKSQHKCKSEYTCNMCKEKACLYKPSYTRLCKECFGVFRNSTCFKNHKQNVVCARATSCEKCGHWLAGPISNHICESFYCTYYNKEVIRNHGCSVEVEKKIENKSWRYVFL